MSFSAAGRVSIRNDGEAVVVPVVWVDLRVCLDPSHPLVRSSEVVRSVSSEVAVSDIGGRTPPGGRGGRDGNSELP
jgi:hypothetical protein